VDPGTVGKVRAFHLDPLASGIVRSIVEASLSRGVVRPVEKDFDSTIALTAQMQRWERAKQHKWQEG
jgi:hypothetical protein